MTAAEHIKRAQASLKASNNEVFDSAERMVLLARSQAQSMLALALLAQQSVEEDVPACRQETRHP